MIIKGLTIIKNGGSLGFPYKESILSILPICDEFIVLLDTQTNDTTKSKLQSLKSNKIKIIDYDSNSDSLKDSLIEDCDWVFCLKPDEVTHEKYLSTIIKTCDKESGNNTEALSLELINFWGDYDHFQDGYGWEHIARKIFKKSAIRGITELIDIAFWGKEIEYDTQEISAKLHKYTWVRPPQIMQKTIMENPEKKEFADYLHTEHKNFDYGTLDILGLFHETHPRAMCPRISKMNWHDSLHYKGSSGSDRPKHRHELLGNRIMTMIKRCFGNKNSDKINDSGKA
jgi:hypothetical protein